MKNDLNDIDLIIKHKLTNSSFSVPEKEWDMLSKHMSFKNFLRFNAGQINIFYVGAVTVLLGFSGIFYAQNLKLKHNIREMEKIIKTNSLKYPVEQKTDENIKEESVNSKVEVPSAPAEKNYIYNSMTSKKAEVKTNLKSELKTDTSKIIAAPVVRSVDSITKKSVKKVVKKKVFIKDNPVILKDTIIKRKNGK